ncbi:MAG: CoA transferase [Actinomycetota bacterium]|nr:CoA transferase [Actinomycetota bacterium]
MPATNTSMLSPYRVLDLSDERGHLCSAVLAGFGADVIVVEPPAGSSARHRGPFAGDTPDPEASLEYWAHNRGKRSVVIDVNTTEGKAQLLDLVRGADILIESADPGFWEGLGLGYADLAAVNPALIHTSITAFGSEGPKSTWLATDLTIAASSGQMWQTGDDDRAPLRISLPQAYYHPCVEGAAAVLIALYERQHSSGLGQHIDLSAQQSLNQAAQSMLLSNPLNADPIGRMAGGLKLGPLKVQLMWPCKDGHVSVTFLFGAALGPPTQLLMNWIYEEGGCDEATRDKDWINYVTLLLDGTEPVSEYERVKQVVGAFLKTKTKAELMEAAISKRLLLAPVTTTQDVLDSPQFSDREFFEQVDQGGDIGTLTYPGAVAKFTATPSVALPKAPALGEHTLAVLNEPPRVPHVPIKEPKPNTNRPLEGLKILDFMWVMAGPAATRVLADWGADIVRLESANRIDTARTLQPFRDNVADPDGSGLFNNMNAGKRDLAIDLRKPEARDVVYDLLDWCDVVTESYSPRGMKGFGFDYETLRRRKPDLIMSSSCLMGQSGPHTSLAGYGTMAAAISGFFNITGWPDRDPSGPFGAYTDYVSPRLLAACLMAAVEHRRETGEGQYIDLSQGESSMPLLSTALLYTQTKGQVYSRQGNSDPLYVPHGVYALAGDDEWVAIVCTNDDQWKTLAGLVGHSDLADLTVSERRGREAELNGYIEAWSKDKQGSQIELHLQSLGIPSHQVNNSPRMVADLQAQHRRHFREIPHEKQGNTVVEGPRFQMSRTPGNVLRGGPTIGQDTFEILTDVLGYDGDRIAELATAELLE